MAWSASESVEPGSGRRQGMTMTMTVETLTGTDLGTRAEIDGDATEVRPPAQHSGPPGRVRDSPTLARAVVVELRMAPTPRPLRREPLTPMPARTAAADPAPSAEVPPTEVPPERAVQESTGAGTEASTETAAVIGHRGAVLPTVERLGSWSMPTYRHGIGPSLPGEHDEVALRARTVGMPRTPEQPGTRSGAVRGGPPEARTDSRASGRDVRVAAGTGGGDRATAARDGRAVGSGDDRSPSELDPGRLCCLIAMAAVEVLTGSRPLAQLARWVTPAIYLALEQRRRLSRFREGTAAEPVLPRAQTSPTGRPTVRRLRAMRLAADVVESTVVLGHADRVRAVAVRLVEREGVWRAEALVVG
ncbi:Rv3235 family protein [Cellulomonas sp. NPDC089187]|uniref:Rv3235 family protein n=1 Tax=Cellulomonas sp. NPDC089187 TaxID=3154970 RepID=UPI003448DA9F